jgi:hypothetical protein
MADPFGIAAGTICIAAASTACVNCFEYESLRTRFQTDRLAINYVRQTSSDTLGGKTSTSTLILNFAGPDAAAAEAQIAKGTL